MNSVFPRLLICIALALTASPSRAEQAVVLVTDKDSVIDSISTLDVRKAYLGISVTSHGSGVNVLRREDDLRLNEVFLQAVMAMSRRSYERRLLSSLLKFGTPRPAEVQRREELDSMLSSSSPAITYMWLSDAESDDSVKILKVVWREN